MIAHNFSRAHLALALASVVFVAFPSFAQDSPPATTPPAAEPQQPMQVASTIKKESRLVLVDTVVTDKISLATVLLTAAKFNPGLVVG